MGDAVAIIVGQLLGADKLKEAKEKAGDKHETDLQ